MTKSKNIYSERGGSVIGLKFNRLTIIGRNGFDKRVTVKCDCGTVKTAVLAQVKNGQAKSCGCFKKEIDQNRFKIHGMSSSAEYTSWTGMISRCECITNKKYHLYGGRGITVCDRWRHSFENFFNDMGPKPNSKFSIDRIDVNGNYEPSNCRWADQKTQCRNKRTTVFIENNGEKIKLSDYVEKRGVSYQTIASRIENNYPIHKDIRNAGARAYNPDRRSRGKLRRKT